MLNAFSLLGAAILAMAADDAYPRPDLLVEANQLANADAESFVVLDARDQAAYDQGHIPGARRVDAAAWAKAFGDGQDAEGWSGRIGQLGIQANSKVLVYDDGASKDAARVWWILRYWGVHDARLLNGGWTAWNAGKWPTQTDSPEPPAAAPFEAQAAPERFADKALLLDSLKDRLVQIVDSRSRDEHCGSAKLSNKRGGAIPGARHLEWSDLLDPQTRRFKKPAELRELFEKAGIDLDQPTATHCQSGGRSSVMAFGLELMGASEVRNYYRGWSEWGNADDTPVVVEESPEN